METRRESVNRIIRSWAFIFLVVILLLAAIISVAFGGTRSDEGSGLKAVASSTETLVRTNQAVIFSAEGSTGHIERYFWQFGDGNTDNGTEVSHAFEMGGWYNVTLTVFCPEGNNDSAVVSVGVQPEDQHNTRDLGRDRDVRPLWAHGYGLLGDVGPHVAPPISTLEYDVIRAIRCGSTKETATGPSSCTGRTIP
jgi:uncharacterized protein (UPF0333 family)